MNGPNDTSNERRYGEKAVVLKRARDVLHGVQFCLYPVDEPPMIQVDSVDRRYYRRTWEDKGWRVYDGFE